MRRYRTITHFRVADNGDTIVLFNPNNDECIEIGKEAYQLFCAIREKESIISRTGELSGEEEQLMDFLCETGFVYED